MSDNAADPYEAAQPTHDLLFVYSKIRFQQVLDHAPALVPSVAESFDTLDKRLLGCLPAVSKIMLCIGC